MIVILLGCNRKVYSMCWFSYLPDKKVWIKGKVALQVLWSCWMLTARITCGYHHSIVTLDDCITKCQLVLSITYIYIVEWSGTTYYTIGLQFATEFVQTVWSSGTIALYKLDLDSLWFWRKLNFHKFCVESVKPFQLSKNTFVIDKLLWTVFFMITCANRNRSDM